MATIIKCDGCEKVLDSQSNARTHITISTETRGTDGLDVKRDLCRSCFDHLGDIADPEKWARPARGEN